MPLHRTVRSIARGTRSRLRRSLRRESPERLFWSVYEPRNFGEWVGPYLYRAIAGREPTFARPSNRDLRTVYTAAGSILRHTAENCVVWGSGIISRSDAFPRPHRVLAVRGPHTRRRMHALGYECPAVYGDPAILLPHFYEPAGEVRRRLGVIPHFTDLDRARELFAGTDTPVIDVTQPVERVVDDIASCEAVASSSLHGIIVAHAYGVPASWVEFSDNLHGDGVKFADHYEGAGSPTPRPHRIEAADVEAIEALVRDAPQPDLTPLSDPLLAACPFPCNN